MKEIDAFLQFCLDNIDDDRLSIQKKIKYKFNYYYIMVDIIPDDTKKKNSNLSSLNRFGGYLERLMITVDNRNECIEMELGSEHTVIEDPEMVKKWSLKMEEYLNKYIDNKVEGMIEFTLQNNEKKDLYRQYKLRKLL